MRENHELVEKELLIGSGRERLSATLCSPSESQPQPLVLMIHGSGPLDRNENMKGQRLDIFNAVAHHLSRSGFASLRYDKRGCGESGGDYMTAGHQDLVDDAVRCFDWLRGSEFGGEQPIFVLGHSEGCLISAELGLKRAELAGIVLLCPFVEPMESILMRQARQLQSELDAATGFGGALQKLFFRVIGMPLSSQKKLLARLETSTEDTFRLRLQKVPAKWLRELIAIDSSEIYRRLERPMLIVGGEKDLQCDPRDVQRIGELAAVPVETHVIPNLTHILRTDEGTPSLLGAHALLSRPVDEVVLNLVSRWLGAQCTGAGH